LKPTDWARRFVEAQAEGQEPPPGWLTAEQWAIRIGRMPRSARERLRHAEADGCAKRKMFRDSGPGAVTRSKVHWWVNGVSDEIARGGVKNKPGGGMRSRK